MFSQNNRLCRIFELFRNINDEPRDKYGMIENRRPFVDTFEDSTHEEAREKFQAEFASDSSRRYGKFHFHLYTKGYPEANVVKSHMFVKISDF